MLFLKHLNSFKIYIIILTISIVVTINDLENLYVLNLIFYLFIHILMIYLGIYFYNNILYLVFFLSGLLLDIFLINEIGPHLCTFMILILFLSRINKTLFKLDSKKILFFIVFLLFICLILESLINFFLFGYSNNIRYFIEIAILTILISYPSFYLFQFIDKFK